MAIGDPYVTLADLKAQLGITDMASDTALTLAINAVSRDIEKFCGRQFNDAGTTSSRVFYADSWHMTEVDDFSTTTGLVVAIDTGDDGTYDTTWLATDYQLLPLNGLVDGETWPYSTVVAGRNRYFPIRTHRPSVQVTAQWGWASVPYPVQQACMLLASEMFKLKDAPFGVLGYADYGPVRVRQNPIAAGLLTSYRRNNVLVA